MSNKRNLTTDLIRLLCAFGVVAIHVKSNTYGAEVLSLVFSPVAVPFFFTISLVFLIRSLNNQSILKLRLYKIVSRLALPYLAWTIIYGSLILVKHAGHHAPLWRMLLYGETGVQMYFLPMLIILQCYILGVFFMLRGNNRNKLLAILVFVTAFIYHFFGFYYGAFGRSTGTFVAFPIYILLAWAIVYQTGKQKASVFFAVFGSLVTLLAVLLTCYGKPLMIWGYSFADIMGGGGVALLACNLPSVSLPKWFLTVLSTSYGVYLSHFVFLQAFELLIKKLLHHPILYNLPTKLGTVVLVFSVSVAFTLLIGRIRLLNTLLFGEDKR